MRDEARTASLEESLSGAERGLLCVNDGTVSLEILTNAFQASNKGLCEARTPIVMPRRTVAERWSAIGVLHVGG